MRIIWMIEDQTPLAHAACELGLRALAKRLGAVVPDDAIVLLQGEGVLGGYPLSQAFALDGTTIWAADYRAVTQVLFMVADAAMKKAGLDPGEPTFESKARQYLRRHFPHWTDVQMEELLSVLPRLKGLASAYAEYDEDDPY